MLVGLLGYAFGTFIGVATLPCSLTRMVNCWVFQKWPTFARRPVFMSRITICNRVGVEDAMEFYGGSMVIDPDGNIVAKAGESEQLLPT